MSRRKTARELQKQLDFAKRREAYVPPDRPEGGTPQRRPKNPVKYNSTGAGKAFTLQASKNSIQYFGGVAVLGLADAADDPTAPRGFKPNRIIATVGDASPNYVRAKGSGRMYIRYARGTRGGETQNTYTAPISKAGATATPTEVKNQFEAVADQIRSRLGGPYGRVWFESERLLLIESGE